jgi:hypothetical protein
MSRNNDVFQVLVPTVAVATTGGVATGTTLAAMTEGQIGAFGFDSGVALDPTAKPTVPFYLAVKIKNLDNVDDINKSAGFKIDLKNEVSFTSAPYVAPVDLVQTLPLKVITCGDEVGVKLEIRNQEAYRLNGYNQVVKNYIVPTSDCTDCDAACSDANCAAVLTSLVDLINADVDSVVVASQTAPTDCDGTTLDGELILTVKPAVLKDWCEINLGYFFPHQTQVIVTPIAGFGPVVETTAMVFEDGAGYDVKQLEYEAGGWNGKPGPYRVGELIGTAFEGFQYFSTVGTKYHVFHASYDQVSVSGWRKDSHFTRTIVAAPNGAVATLINTFMTAIFG